MDLEILFWIVFLLAPVLSRLLRGKPKKGRSPSAPSPRPAPRPQQQSQSRELTPFEEALRQIQEALTEGRAAEREPEPVARPRPELVRSPPRDLQKPAPEFREPVKPSAPPRFFDEKFEAAAPFGAPLGRGEHYHEPLGDDADLRTAATHQRKRRKLSKWQQAVQNVVLLSEPRSRKPWSPGPQ